MTRLAFNTPNCSGATSALSGKYYKADSQGFIHVSDPADAAYLKQGGYIEAGGMPRVTKWWHCDECEWDSNINHCRYCDSEDLTRMESD